MRGPPRKLTEDDVREIRIMINKGFTTRMIAKRFGISPSTVSQINTHVKWKGFGVIGEPNDSTQVGSN